MWKDENILQDFFPIPEGGRDYRDPNISTGKHKQENMLKNWCLNGTMVHTAVYSSPVPFIGLYTTAATMVCLILIICDVWAGYRLRKPWLPCRYFSFNSVTLALISVASKLPVDLTTPMPSAQDQLSKLSGTVFICIFMAFLMPSLGILEKFESYANLLALSIFIVTVVVNICIQLATGVIFSFVIEHTIIMFFMLVILCSLWAFNYSIIGHKGVIVDRNKILLTKGSEGCMLQRLQVCYLHGYCSCPQLGLPRSANFGTVSLISNICLVVLIQAVIRSLYFSDVQFCKGCSDYGWSVWILVWAQIVTIIVSNLAVGCRWLTLAGDMNWIDTKSKRIPHRHPHLSYLQTMYPFYMRNLPTWLDLCLRYVYYFTVLPVSKLVEKLVTSVSKILGLVMHNSRRKHSHDERSIEHYKVLLQKNNVKIRKWILSKAAEDMEILMETNRSKSLHHLRGRLSSTTPSRVSLDKNLNSQFYSSGGGEESYLSIVLLVKMVKVVFQDSPVSSMMEDILDEAFEIVRFVDNTMNVRSFNNKIKSIAAEVLWKGNTTFGFIDREVAKNMRDSMVQFPADLDQALRLIADFHKSFVVDVVRNEALALASFLHRRVYSSIDELSVQMKLLFVDMLYVHLAHFPVAIFNHIVESPAEEYEERVRLGLKLICQMELLDSYMSWSFPVGSNFTSLTNVQIAATEIVNCCPMEDSVACGSEEVEVIESFQEDDNP